MRGYGRGDFRDVLEERPWTYFGGTPQGKLSSLAHLHHGIYRVQALRKASTKPSSTLDKNVRWNEIAAYSRLALGMGQVEEHALQIQPLVQKYCIL